MVKTIYSERTIIDVTNFELYLENEEEESKVEAILKTHRFTSIYELKDMLKANGIKILSHTDADQPEEIHTANRLMDPHAAARLWLERNVRNVGDCLEEETHGVATRRMTWLNNQPGESENETN